MNEKIRIGMIGLGTVGTGVLRILRQNADLIRRHAGIPVDVERIAVRDLSRRRAVDLPPDVLAGDAMQVVDDPRVDIVVELIGGYSPAKELLLRAISNGKHIVTANKALLARDGAEIFEAARQAGVYAGIEASVAGGIPVVKVLKESLAGNRILSIYGIINGTSNYILTKMTDEDREFADVLDEAQRAGYAEADPSFDVGGLDAAQKLAILVNIAFGASISSDRIFTEGITAIRPLDIEFGKEFGYRLKLLAIAKAADGEIEARVHPTLVPDASPIAKVDGVYNAIQIVGDACGDLMLYGRGAGSLPTGSAVVGDVMDISRAIVTGASALPVEAPAPFAVRSMEAVSRPYYLRFMALDRPGVLSQISGILGRWNISIEKMIQRGRKEGGSVPLVIMTHTALERDVQNALVEIRGLTCVSEEPVLIRVEE